MAHIILFQHANFHGAHKHVFGCEPNLNAADDNFFNDKVSSFVVLEGVWTLFRDINYGHPASHSFPPGMYNWVEYVDVPNDSISSLKPENMKCK